MGIEQSHHETERPEDNRGLGNTGTKGMNFLERLAKKSWAKPKAGEVANEGGPHKEIITGNRELNELLKQGEKIGGRILIENIKDAEIIALGALHNLPEHRTWKERIFRLLARPGDIVLVEGIPSGLKIDPKLYKQTNFIPRTVTTRGWDNMVLHKKTIDMLKEERNLYNRMKNAKTAKDEEIYMQQYNELYSNRNDIEFRQRNLSLAEEVKKIKQQFPDKKIFIFAGSGHFTKDPDLKRILEAYSYIALQSTYTEPQEVMDKKAMEYALNLIEEADSGSYPFHR